MWAALAAGWMVGDSMGGWVEAMSRPRMRSAMREEPDAGTLPSVGLVWLRRAASRADTMARGSTPNMMRQPMRTSIALIALLAAAPAVPAAPQAPPPPRPWVPRFTLPASGLRLERHTRSGTFFDVVG